MKNMVTKELCRQNLFIQCTYTCFIVFTPQESVDKNEENYLQTLVLGYFAEGQGLHYICLQQNTNLDDNIIDFSLHEKTRHDFENIDRENVEQSDGTNIEQSYGKDIEQNGGENIQHKTKKTLNKMSEKTLNEVIERDIEENDGANIEQSDRKRH